MFSLANRSHTREKAKSVSPALPRAGHGDTPAPAVIRSLPRETKTNSIFFFSPKYPPGSERYAVERRFSREKRPFHSRVDPAQPVLVVDAR